MHRFVDVYERDSLREDVDKLKVALERLDKGLVTRRKLEETDFRRERLERIIDKILDNPAKSQDHNW